MSSRDGAARADIDTGLFDDPKVKQLARFYGDPQATATAMCLYIATVLASWSENRPVSIVEAAPAWFVQDPTTIATGLMKVGLLDVEGRVPEPTLSTWMRRYRAAVAGGLEGAARRWGGNALPNGTPNGEGIAHPNGGSMPSRLYRQDGRPSDRPALSTDAIPRAARPPALPEPAREVDTRSFDEIMAANGLVETLLKEPS